MFRLLIPFSFHNKWQLSSCKAILFVITVIDIAYESSNKLTTGFVYVFKPSIRLFFSSVVKEKAAMLATDLFADFAADVAGWIS